MELSLLQEKRSRKVIEDKTQRELEKQQLADNAEIDKLRKSLKSAKSRVEDFESKVSEAYVEVRRFII